MTKSRGEDVRVSLGGLLQSTSGGIMGSNGNAGIYPSASSASEFEEEDENARRSSGDARACSTLLHAMWQIDYRIREPPKFKYAFDLLQGSNSGESIPLKEATDAPHSADSTPHRLPFQCTASLEVGFSTRLLDGKDPKMEYWESPLEHLQSKPSAKSPQRIIDNTNEQSRKRKDSFTSQTTLSPARQAQNQEVESTELSSSNALLLVPKEEELITHIISSTATAPTKRESKHKASAKLLAMLFPECSSVVEVMAAAEAARECYALKKKAQTKRAKLSNEYSLNHGNSKSSWSPTATGILSPSEKEEKGTKKDILEEALVDQSLKERTEEAATDGYFSVAGLSLSEPTNSKEDLDCEINDAIRSMYKETENEQDTEDYRVRRATPDDFECICALLKKLRGESSPSELETDFVLQPSGLVAILLLVRADSSQCDKTFGVAILSLFEKSTDRTLAAHVIQHEDYLSSEIFMGQLNKLASVLDCSLDVSSIDDDGIVSSKKIISLVRKYIFEKTPINMYGKHQELSSSHLQSVLEEDSDVADGSEDEEGNELAGRKRSRVEN